MRETLYGTSNDAQTGVALATSALPNEVKGVDITLNNRVANTCLFEIQRSVNGGAAWTTLWAVTLAANSLYQSQLYFRGAAQNNQASPPEVTQYRVLATAAAAGRVDASMNVDHEDARHEDVIANL